MKQLKFYVIIILLVILIVPSVAFASWYNPFSWHIWGNFWNYFFQKQTSTIQQQNTQNIIKTDVEKDCGISDAASESQKTSSGQTDWEKDPAMVCLGQSLANNCAKAKIILNNNGDESLLEIGGGSSNCKMKITVIKLASNPSLVNKYMECSPSKLLYVVSGGKQTMDNGKILQEPGTTMGGFLTLMLFTVGINPKQAIDELGCDGDYLISILNSANIPSTNAVSGAKSNTPVPSSNNTSTQTTQTPPSQTQVPKDACVLAGGVFCGNGQCPTGNKIINGEFCCFGTCYDSTKFCSVLGGTISPINSCSGYVISSYDTFYKTIKIDGQDAACCVPK
jgi:hypothetical protein